MVEGLHLSPMYRKEIEALLHKHLPGVEVWAYGSRVNGRSHDGSDLDLVLRGPKLAEIGASLLGDFIEALQNSTIPFLVEARDWARLPESFHREIEREHVVLAAVAQDSAPEEIEKEAAVVRERVENKQTKRGEWQEVSIEEIALRVAMGPFGSDIKTDNFVAAGVPVIRGGNLTCGRFNPEKFVFLTDYKADELLNANAYPGDIVFTHRGTLGQVGLVPEGSSERYVISQSQMKLTCDPDLADPPYIYYFFKSPVGQYALLMHTSQTGVPAISRPVTSLKSIRLPLPPLPEQRVIAHILGTLDDKIELHRRMNQTLEAMARALFKSWFVDFDPVRAKMADRGPGLPKHLGDLFPDRLVDSELGKIPEGWEVVPLSEIMNFKEGPGIRHWQYTNSAEGTRFINIRCIQDGDLLLSTSNRITTEEADGKYAHFHLKEGDIVVSSSGTLGRSAVVRKAHLPLLLNTSVIRFRPIGGVTSFSYLHGYLNSSIFLDELKSSASGSVQKNVGPTHLKKMRVLFPPYNCIERYEEIAGPFLQKANIKRTDNAALTALRDTLLPRLVSGEVRVNVYDQRIEEAM